MQMSVRPTTMEYLGNKHFSAILAATFFAHLLVVYGWSLMPSMKILDIPVRALNIRLGDSAEMQQMEDEAAPQPISQNNSQIEAEMNRLTRQEAEKNKPVQKPQEIKKSEPPKPTPPTPAKEDNSENVVRLPKQFVRKTEPLGKGLAIGNSAENDAQVKARYEETVSLWVYKFQIYPEEARLNKIEGKPVVRVRIDRRGNIRKSEIEVSSGSEILDRAALDGVRRANPVPAVPDNYTGQDAFEFLIPVNFYFEEKK